QRQHGDVEDNAVGHHDLLVAARELRVQEAKRADGALQLAADLSTLKSHAVADAKRSRAEQDRPRDHVAERLLSGETDDDRRKRAAERERARLDTSNPQGNEQCQPCRDEAYDEADRTRGGGVKAPEQRRAEAAPNV